MDLVLDKNGMRLEKTTDASKDFQYPQSVYNNPRCNGCGDIMSKRKWDNGVLAWHYYCDLCENAYKYKDSK